MKREGVGFHQSVTIDVNGVLCVWGRAVNYDKPFVILRHEEKEYVCFVTSDANMGKIHL